MTLVHKNGHNLTHDQYLSAIIHETGGPPQRGAGGGRETKVSFGVALADRLASSFTESLKRMVPRRVI